MKYGAPSTISVARPSCWTSCGIGCASRVGGAIQTAADSSREHAAAAFHVTHFLPMHCLPTGEKRRNPTRSVIHSREHVWKCFPHWNPGFFSPAEPLHGYGPGENALNSVFAETRWLR